jgi:hypothetical protein
MTGFASLVILASVCCGFLAGPEAAFGQRTATTKPNTAGEPARFPLELVSPREADTSPSPDDGSPSISGGHRIFKAYPDLEYNIRAVVIGGSYPYRYSLTDAPAGMTIDPNTGEIKWPQPTGTSATPKITVVDAEGTTRGSKWTIRIAADGFRFVDAVKGNDSNAGTLDAPWKSLAQVKASEAAGTIVYFRTGNYKTTDMTAGGGDTWTRVEFNGRVHPVQWLAYPGEKPVIDHDFKTSGGTGRFIRITGAQHNPVYLDGLEITGARHMALQYGSGPCDFPVFRRLSIHGIAEGIDGANSAGIMTLTSPGDPTWYAAYQDCDFHHNAPGGIKQYSQKKLLWEDCKFRDSGIGPDLKADVVRFEVRGCTFAGNRGPMAGLFGNMHPARGGGQITGEIRFNRMLCGHGPDLYALEVNQDGLANEIHIYRNTLLGVVNVRSTDSADGPFRFSRNVIVNLGSGAERVRFEAVSDPSRVVFAENLVGSPADGIVDAEGKLLGSYKSHIGRRGHQLPKPRE